MQGKSDTEPLLPDNPTSPRNRRISIVLLRQGDSGGIATTGAGPTVGGHGAVTEQEGGGSRFPIRNASEPAPWRLPPGGPARYPARLRDNYPRAKAQR